MKQGILIIGHGSRAESAVEEFNKIVAMVKENRPELKVEGAHMELAEPSIETVSKNYYDDGVREIIALPYFLYEGVHIKEDIPEILEEIEQKYDGLKFKMARPIGADPMIAKILLQRAEEFIKK